MCKLAISPDGKVLAAADETGGVQLWDVAARSPITDVVRGYSGFVGGLRFSKDGTVLAAGNVDGTVRIVDADRRAPDAPSRTYLPDEHGQIYKIAFSSGGRLLASASLAHNSRDGTVTVWDVQGRQLLREIPHENWSSVAFSRDGAKFATVGLKPHEINLQDNQDGAVFRRISVVNVGINDVAFSPDGATLASAGGHEVDLWELREGSRIRRLVNPATRTLMQAEFSKVLFGPAGEWVATGGSNTPVELWRLFGTDTKARYLGDPAANQSCLALSRDGKILAVGQTAWIRGWMQSAIQLWNASAISPKGEPFDVDDDELLDIDLTPDGRILASTSHRSIRLWDAPSGRQLGRPISTWPLLRMAFSPNGKLLAYGQINGQIGLLDTDFDNWEKRLCVVAGRGLSDTEWRNYVATSPMNASTCFAL